MNTSVSGGPRTEDVQVLPCWARTAFAARCARRVQPLLAVLWADGVSEWAPVIEEAITVAEASASAADRIYNAVDIACAAYDAALNAPPTARALARAAGAAADAADRAPNNVDDATAAVDDANTAARGVPASLPFVGEMIWRDYQQIRALTRGPDWSDDTPVPSSVFGPMWPDGPPPGWPTGDATDPNTGPTPSASPDVPSRRLILRAVTKPGATPDDIAHELHTLYRVLNEYHLAHGGSGLTADDFQLMVAQAVTGGVI